MKICAVIPAHNEDRRLPDVIRKTLPHCHEVIVVDDGSSDRSAELAQRAGAEVLQLKRKSGKGTALRAGFSHALKNGFDAILTIDADGQHNPEDIPRFIRCAQQKDQALVTGNRMANSTNMPIVRRFTNWATSKTLSLSTGHEVRDSQCGYRLIRTDLLRQLPLQSKKYDIETEVLLEANARGVKPCEIPIECVYQKRGHTHNYSDVGRFLRQLHRHFSHWRTIFHLFKFVITSSLPPLKTAAKLLSFPLLVTGAIAMLWSLGEGSLLTNQEAIQSTLLGWGILAPILLVCLCAVKPLTFVPFSGLTVIAGTVFGFWYGSLLIFLGGMSGAFVGFYFARFYGRGLANRYLTKRFPQAENWIMREGWSSVLILRLMNVPWDWVSYAGGLSNLSFRPFILATILAGIPVAMIGTYFGAALWTFPSWNFFIATGVLIGFGTLTFLVQRRTKVSRVT